MSGLPDAFGLDRLRAAVLRAWEDSPTRLTEDTNAERDLRAGGYRDRLLVELAQNAADAAALAGRPGHLRVAVTGGELRVANTGAPLDEAGVAALASLRASAKPAGTVGRFGVGFAAVLAVTSEPRIVSSTGGVVFSEQRTKAEAGADDVPVLRLPWPPGVDEPPVPDGFDTEVRLPLTVPAGDVLAAITADVPDLLLALPRLARVDVDGRTWTRSEEKADAGGGVVMLSTPEGTARWLTHAEDGVVWALPVDDADAGTPVPRTEDVLHTPTPTDERLSLPARLFAPVPVEPSRRRVLTGEAARPVLAAAARIYPRLARRLESAHRSMAVPEARFPLSEVDAELRDLVIAELSEQDWLPAVAGGEVAGGRARVLPVDAPELVGLLADVVPGLAVACGPGAARLLETVGARAIGVAEVAEALTGIDRTPAWWHGLYDALLAAVERREIDPAELGGIPVPLADGRTVPGPRGALLPDPALAASGLDDIGGLDVVGLHLVHPEAAHPLLERLGADRAGPAELLASPALREAVQRSVEDAVSGVDVRPFVDAVLRLSGHGDAAELGALALPARSGWRRADELVLPGAPVLEVFDPEAVGEDGALDVLDETFAGFHDPAALTALGVLDSFALVTDDEPAEADHELPDEAAWWEAAAPARVYAVRDLDLVADDAWPAAIRLLAQRPETWRALTEPGGHTPWWLARFALLGGRAPMDWRMPAAHDLAGLFDPVPDVGLSPEQLAVVGVRGGLPDASTVDSDDVADLCDRLADPDRSVPLGLTLRVHRLVGEHRPVATGGHVDPPDRVRTLDGAVADAEDVVVLDGPWLLGAAAPSRFVACATAGTPGRRAGGTGGGSDAGIPDTGPVAALAEAFDLPLATDVIDADVSSEGEFAAWPELPAVVEVAELLGVALPEGGVVVHDHLTVAGADVSGNNVAVPWWCRPDPHGGPAGGAGPAETGVLHATDTSDGLARAFAWAAGLWLRRWEIAALLDDPDPRTLLG